MDDRIAVRQAIVFSAITLGLSYLVFWGPIALLKIQTISFVSNIRGPIWAVILFILGGFVPSVVAIVMAAISGGAEGLRALLRRSMQFNLGFKWYFAIVLVVVLAAIGQIGINLRLGHLFDFSLYASQLPSFLPLLVLGPLSEEYGWRGYLLVRLQHRWSALVSSIVVGVVWALWHLPLFYMIGTSQHELHLPFLGFFLGIVAVSVLMAWVNNNTRNSLWAAILFHWLYTYTTQVNASGVTRSVTYNWLEFAPYVLIAIAVVILWRPKHLVCLGNGPTSPDAG